MRSSTFDESSSRSTSSSWRRPGIRAALEVLEKGDAKALVAAKLDRLSRSMVDFTRLMAVAQKQGWALVALDCAVDTTTPSGEAMAHMLATFAQFERQLIGQRTRDALAVKKAQGVRLGRPPALPPKVVRRVLRERKAGKSLAAIAEELNADRVPTAQGGERWHPSTVAYVAKRAEGQTSERKGTDVTDRTVPKLRPRPGQPCPCSPSSPGRRAR